MSPDPEPRPAWAHPLIIGRRPWRTLWRIVTLVVTCFVLFRFVLVPIRISGISMLPTYRDDQINFVNKLAYLRNPPRRGDVVSIRYTGQSIMLMKRIVGLPGERVRIQNGIVKIDGKPLDEPYVKNRAPWNRAEEQLAEDEYFVMGDNRSMAIENHAMGRVSANKIVGKALL